MGQLDKFGGGGEIEQEKQRQEKLAEYRENERKANESLKLAKDGIISFDAIMARLLKDKEWGGLSIPMIRVALSGENHDPAGWTAGALESLADTMDKLDEQVLSRKGRSGQVRELAMKLRRLRPEVESKEGADLAEKREINPDERARLKVKLAKEELERVRAVFSEVYQISL